MEMLRSYSLRLMVPVIRTCRQAGKLTRLLVGFAVVFSLMAMQLQVCPQASAADGELMVICTESGSIVIEVPLGTPSHEEECNRCPDCMTCSSSALGLLDRVSILQLPILASSADKPAYATLHIDHPDHLLPFSGAPPPEKSNQIMTHIAFVPALGVPTQFSVMPEVVSWH